jgi:2'-5' RNA ligase
MSRAADDRARPIRSFVALEVEEPARAAMIEYLGRLRSTVDGVAWTRPENLHVTLKFLGNVVPDVLAVLADRLAGVAAAQPAFPVAFRGVGAFPGGTRPRILWIGADAQALAPLAAAVDGASVAVGATPAEDRPFHPHVTLGRTRERRGGSARRRQTGAGVVLGTMLADDRTRDFGEAPARAIILMRSETGPGGSRYMPLGRFPLAG